MKDWIDDMIYSSWCKVTLKRKIEDNVKGRVCIEIVNEDALVEILSEDYAKKYYAQIVYDFGLKMENHELSELDLVNISGKIVERFRSKILKKYFK